MNKKNWMTRRLKSDIRRACKVLIPILVFIYVAGWVRNFVEKFWYVNLLNRWALFKEGNHATLFLFLAGIGLTLTVFILIGEGTRLKFVNKFFDALRKKVKLLGYFWSSWDDDTSDNQSSIPVAFEYPRPGLWKLGIQTGSIKMGGKKFAKVFFIPAAGDHQLIDESRPDLLVPLKNDTAEILHFLTSLTMGGPAELHPKAEKGK